MQRPHPIRAIRALLAIAGGLALATPVFAQGMATQRDPEGSVSIVSARNLTGHTIRDMAGESLGEIRYVLIGLDGDVAALAVRPDEGAQPDLLVVPWSALQFGFVENEIRVSAQQSRLREAPRFSQDALAQLTKPAAWTTVTEFWAPIAAVAQVGQRATAQQAAQPSGQQQTGAQQAAQPGSPPGAVPGAQQAAGPGTATGAAAGQAQGQTDGLILVGRNLVTTMASPAFRFSDQLRGAEVVTREGQEVGEIDEVAIDPHSGAVAFVTVRQGGALGFGTKWYAVPIQALTWTSDADRLQLTANRQKLQEIDALDASRTPMRVERTQLASLYQRFDVQPYWQQGQAPMQPMQQQMQQRSGTPGGATQQQPGGMPQQ